MNLEQRASAAAAGIKGAVAAADMRLPMPGSAVAAPPTRLLAFAGAVVVAVLLGFIFFQLAPPAQFADDVIPPERNPIIEEGPPPSAQSVDTTTAPATTETTRPVVESAPSSSLAPTTTSDTSAPFLEVTSPTPGSSTDNEFIRFEGRTEPGAVVTAGQYVADQAEDGTWWIVLRLAPGPNRAAFTATDAAGNVAAVDVIVTYVVPTTQATTPPPTEPPPTTEHNEPPPTEPKPEVAFAVEQQFGSCEENPPFDVFWGTAPPGTTVSVTSAHGSGSTVANGDGNFEILVQFPSAPYGETFTVTVSNGGQSKGFSFVSWAS